MVRGIRNRDSEVTTRVVRASDSDVRTSAVCLHQKSSDTPDEI